MEDAAVEGEKQQGTKITEPMGTILGNGSTGASKTQEAGRRVGIL